MTTHDRECPYSSGEAPEGAVCHCEVFGGRQRMVPAPEHLMRVTYPSQTTPSAILGEALTLLREARRLMVRAECRVSQAPLAQVIAEVEMEREAEVSGPKPCPCACHVTIPDLHCLRCAPVPTSTPAKMMDKARGAVVSALVDVGRARVLNPSVDDAWRRRPTLFGAPIVEDPSIPAGHVDMERRDGTRVRFDLRTAAERMEAEARDSPGMRAGRSVNDCAEGRHAWAFDTCSRCGAPRETVSARDPSPGVG